jgi:hypothetical protein
MVLELRRAATAIATGLSSGVGIGVGPGDEADVPA